GKIKIKFKTSPQRPQRAERGYGGMLKTGRRTKVDENLRRKEKQNLTTEDTERRARTRRNAKSNKGQPKIKSKSNTHHGDTWRRIKKKSKTKTSPQRTRREKRGHEEIL
ncbi:MAG TPA: hypothetical protein VI636_10950, partial [Candidatus Angelobacter sp.]